MRRIPHRAVAAALAGVALAAAGCGTSKTAPPSQPAAGVRVVVTADWGATPIARGSGPAGDVLAATGAVAATATSYGGRYVDAIDGKAGDGSRDWIFWVDGVESPVGAAEARVQAGDAVWWDLHRWRGRVHVPAVVGQWPLPLTRGPDGVRRGLTADPPLAAALRAGGADVGQPAMTIGPRAVVGSAAELAAREPLWRRAVADTAASGLTAWIDRAGAVRVWDAEAGRARAVPTAVAVIVATTDGFGGGDPPVVFVAGTSHAAAVAAAQLLAQHPETVRDATAVCLDRSGATVCHGGNGAVQ